MMRRTLIVVALSASMIGAIGLPAPGGITQPVAYLERQPNGLWFPVYQGPAGKVVLATIDSVTAPSISPDGSRVAFSGVVGDGSIALYAIYVVNVDGSGLTRLTNGSYGEHDPSWSPDGSVIVYSFNNTGSLSRTNCCRLGRVTVSSGSVSTLTDRIGAIRPDYSPAGNLIVFDTPTGVYTMPSGGGTASLRAPGGYDASFSPDGTRLVYVARSGGNYVIRSLSAGGGTATTLYTTGRVVEAPEWAGDRVYFVEHLGFGYDGRRSVTHRSVPATGGAAVVEASFTGKVAELGMGASDPTRHVLGDATGEGRDDLAMLAAGRRLLLESTGSSFGQDDWGSLDPMSGWALHLPGDFDGDGRADTAGFRNGDGTWHVSVSSGSSFTTSTWANYSTNSGWKPQLTGDFNGDGRDDIANYFPGNGTWWVSRSTGSSFATAQWADYSTASGWKTHLVGDFNGDGRDDIASFHPSNGTWFVSRSTGSSFAIGLWADFSTASGWTSQIVGDFNGDGRDDIANFHPSNGTWWVSRSTGSSFNTAQWADFSTATGWSSQIAGDFNGDGRDDIANFHPSNGTWWVSRSTGSALVTGLWADFSTASGWSPQVVGDFDGDGRDDIANYFAGNGTWWISRSNGSAFGTGRWFP